MPKEIGPRERAQRALREAKLARRDNDKPAARERRKLKAKRALKKATSEGPARKRASPAQSRRSNKAQAPRAAGPSNTAKTKHREGTISANKPWEAEGISRRTWYRKQQSK